MNDNKVRFLDRCYAYLFDLTIINIISIFIIVYLKLNQIATFFVINSIYFVILESSNLKGSIGKMMLGISISDSKGEKISFLRACLRNIIKILFPIIFSLSIPLFQIDDSWDYISLATYTSIILLISNLISPFKKNSQSLHDYFSGCYLVQVKNIINTPFKNTKLHFRERISSFIIDSLLILAILYFLDNFSFNAIFYTISLYYLIQEMLFDTTIGKFLLLLKLEFKNKNPLYKLFGIIIRNSPQILVFYTDLDFYYLLIIFLGINYLSFYVFKDKTLLDFLSGSKIVRKYTEKDHLSFSNLVIFFAILAFFIMTTTLPGFIPSERTRLRMNVREISNIIDDYQKNNKNTYPKNIDELESNAKKLSYWKQIKNPITNKTVKTYTFYSGTKKLSNKIDNFYEKGSILYFPKFSKRKEIIGYTLYSVSNIDGELLIWQNKIFFIDKQK